MSMVKEIRMRTSINKIMLGVAAVASAMLGAVGAASAATTVTLTAQRVTASMPDGASIPMWGYCGITDSTKTNAGITVGGACVTGGSWSPGPTIVVPVGDVLTINLSNMLPVATSVTILGQLGGGLGKPVRDASAIVHSPAVGTTWPVTGGTSTFTPPTQVARANSFVPVAGAMSGTTAGSQIYTWSNLKPGTYLYETGTRPSRQAPMGRYGFLIVTNSPPLTAGALTAGTAFPSGAINGVAVNPLTYDSDAALLISEIDAVQNAAVDAAATNNNPAGWETTKWTPTCGAACYPPAVNYAPTYLLLNGQPFDLSNPSANAV